MGVNPESLQREESMVYTALVRTSCGVTLVCGSWTEIRDRVNGMLAVHGEVDITKIHTYALYS